MKANRPGVNPPAAKSAVEILPPSYALRAKAPLTETDLEVAVARANAALKDLRGEYLTILEEECNVLYAACAEVEKTGGHEAAVTRLSRMAHEIRGHSGTIGFDAVCKVCDSLCSFLAKRETLPQRGIEIARLHLDALIVILRNVDDWQSEGRFDAVFRDLAKVTRKFDAA